MAIAELAPKESVAAADHPRTAPGWLPTMQRWTIVFLLVGVGWRLFRYLLQFPIWGDEAYTCINLTDQTYLGFLDGLRCNLVAPLLFLWGELTALHWLGSSELAMRLLPVLAGLAALPVFWKLARQVLDPAAATLAFGILAVAYYPVRHAVEVKPYSLDLLVSAGLISIAYAWLTQPQRVNLLTLLCMLLPPALLISNPVVFVAGGISVALLPTVWREPARTKALWAAYNIVLGLTFLGCLYLNARMQPASAVQMLERFWSHTFPPMEPLALLKWLALTHTGNMMAYPLGGKNGGSAVTFLLFLVGVWHFARARRWDVLLLCLTPFALTFIAACLRRYPYGDSARLCQHLAPATCLLIAAGAFTSISWIWRNARGQQIATGFVCGMLAIIGVAGIARDLVQPYKQTGDQECRRIVRAIVDQAGTECPVVFLNDWDQSQPELLWYLSQGHPQVIRHERANWSELALGGRVVCLRIAHDKAPPQPHELPAPWRLNRHDTYSRPLDYHIGITEILEAFEFQIDSHKR